MEAEKNLGEQFQAERPRLVRAAYRMLGSLAEAEDAVQESWLRFAKAGPLENPSAWLTTVVARICLDMLRARKARREEPAEAAQTVASADDPAQERELADSVGLALLVVLQALEPAERIAFVLHDMFDLPFEQISPILGRSNDATRQLASRARKRVRNAPKDGNAVAESRVVDAFLTAARNNDFDALLAALDPQVVFRGDETAIRMGGPRQVSGAGTVAKFFAGRAQAARAALIDGKAGVVVAPQGRLLLVMDVTIANGRITALEAIADPERLAGFTFTLAE